MKTVTKREIVLHLYHLPVKITPSHIKFKEECEKFVCDRLSLKPAHLNSKLGAMVINIRKYYKASGLYLSAFLSKGPEKYSVAILNS